MELGGEEVRDVDDRSEKSIEEDDANEKIADFQYAERSFRCLTIDNKFFQFFIKIADSK